MMVFDGQERCRQPGDLELSAMQDFQDEFCRAHHLYGVCQDSYNQCITQAFGTKEEWDFLHRYVGAEHYEQLTEQLKNSTGEKIMAYAVNSGFIRRCALAVWVEKKLVAVWHIFGIIKEDIPASTRMLPCISTVTQQDFDNSVRFLKVISKHHTNVFVSEDGSPENTNKNQASDKNNLQSILSRRITKDSLTGAYVSLEAILENVGCGICVKDTKKGQILFTNESLRALFPKSTDAGLTPQIFDIPQAETMEKGSVEVYVDSEGKWFDFHFTKIIWVDGRRVSLFTIYDITDTKVYQQKIERQANNDFLTGLYNRMRCEQDLANYIGQTKETGGQGALLYIDLDDFKHINDGLGHRYGDVLLKAISHGLQRIAGIEDTCYRMGGDEFIIIVTQLQYHDLGRILDEIGDIFAKPWFLKGADYYCTMSMGIVRFPADGDSVQELIKKADIALYEAKRCGKNRYEFYAENVDTSFQRLDLETNMRNATMNACDEFEVYYQPIMNIQKPGNPCMGAEALLRWNSKSMGIISPTEFIPLAEYLGLINPIGDHILREACLHCKKWNDSGHPQYKVNVNLSVVQLLQNDIADKVAGIIAETGIKPVNLTLEVTESLAINDMARMKEVLGKIKALGVRVALDDFGTGYSSLNHLREMPIDVIKIDRYFIQGLGKDEYADIFVKMVAELAETLGMFLCIEGVENSDQYNILKNMKIHMIQGFYFDKPMDITTFEEKYL